MRRLPLALAAALALCACETVPDADPDSATTRTVVARPRALPPVPPIVTRPPPPVTDAPVEPTVERPSRFAALEGWAKADLAPALSAFRLSCQTWTDADPEAPLSPRLPQYGTFADWALPCAAAALADDPRTFFEAEFAPVALSTPDEDAGLLTGYYEPVVPVRRVPGDGFTEPVLAVPDDPAVQRLPRAELGPTSSRVIAYGRPADVFFMQVQGSGRLRFNDGLSLRAAYAGHNSKPYTSIGGVLIRRGELTRDTASKASIERWMRDNGPEATRELMNANARYIFFEEQAVPDTPGGTGPRGAMRVPLTDMGSIALDPRYHPYGTVAFLQTRLPRRKGDFRAAPASLLVVGQDTGGAIKGPLRADLFFGSGDEAGDLAGVMKHPVRWTLLLPRAIAPSDASVAMLGAGEGETAP